jgi:hypothetical protein
MRCAGVSDACRAGRTAEAVAALTAHLSAARDFVLGRWQKIRSPDGFDAPKPSDAFF